MTCKGCVDPSYKNWHGDDPKCSFLNGVFSSEGWNCATAGAIRKHLNCWDNAEDRSPLVLFCERHDDQCQALIRISDEAGIDAHALWVTWYKNRGRTEGMWLLRLNDVPRPPTEEECSMIAATLDKNS